jgi:nicotinamidase-related amidase
LLANRSVLPYNADFDLDTLDTTASQIIVEKNNLDLFTNPHVPALLTKLNVTECFVYGVFIDYCVKCALLGLIRSGRRVSLVTDASASISSDAGDLVIRDFVAAGGHVIASDSL